MPPPSDCSKNSTQSINDHAIDRDNNDSNSEISNFVQAHSTWDLRSALRNETTGFVKTLLGPSLEDAVLKTLEFGKALIQKPDGLDLVTKEKKMFETFKKEFSDDSQRQLNLNFISKKEKKISDVKEENNFVKKNNSRKNVVFEKDKDKKGCVHQKTKKPLKKLANVSKIRSLDSDLKQKALSPEKIKKQLEALIQINKDMPPEHASSWNCCPKKTTVPVEMTVMPSICIYDNPLPSEAQRNTFKSNGDGNAVTTRTQHNKRLPNKICQAPEFLSNALGPTLDVSLIDNIKMMRDIFKCESAKGEELPKPVRPSIRQQAEQEVRFQNSEAEMTYRIEELHKKIEELEEKERFLAKQIEDEECERECKRRAFEEEEKKMTSTKSVCDELSLEKKKTSGTLRTETSLEAKHESLQARIACEEEKLLRLKAQNENFKREMTEAKYKTEALKRNKALLDAWDVFASRVCHTRLPSFSKVHTLERKEFGVRETGNLHCCFPVLNTPVSENTKNKSRSRCPSGVHDFQNAGSNPSATQGFESNKCRSRSPSRSDTCCGNHDNSSSLKNHGKNESNSNVRYKIKLGEIQFPIQRDITCGLHQMMSICSCKHKTLMKHEGHICSSEDDLFRRRKVMETGNKKEHFIGSLGLDSSAELVAKRGSKEEAPCRSKSDTSLKKEKCSRIVKVMWATARINIFQDNCRTYEIMDTTSKAPSCLPAKTEGIFVVKTPQKKICPSFSNRKWQPSVP